MARQRTGLLIVWVGLSGCAGWISRTQAPASAPRNGSDSVPQAFSPGLDDLMTLLIQPRHIRLFYAGVRGNWELAASEVRDLRAGFTRVSQIVPTYLGAGIDEAVTSMVSPALQSVETAISKGDIVQFERSYESLTASCNACHAYLEHPFHIIKVPTAIADGAYPDQEFQPKVPQWQPR